MQKRTTSRAQIAPSDKTEEHPLQLNHLDGNFKAEEEMSDGSKHQKQSNNSQQIVELLVSKERQEQILQEQQTQQLQEQTQLLAASSPQKSKWSPFGNKRMFYVTTFIKKVKQFSSYIKFTQSSKQLLIMINDIAFDYDYFYFKRVFQNESPSLIEIMINYLKVHIVEKIVDLDKKSKGVMMPNSLPSRIWDFIQFMMLLLYIMYLPIRLAFGQIHESNAVFWVLEILPNMTQIINMILEFNTGYFSNGVIILSRRSIFMNYVKRKFLYDLTLNICWCVSLYSGSSIWWKTIGILRVIVLMKLINEIEQTFSLRELLGSYFSLVKLGGFIFLCSHLMGCCWYAIADYEKSQGISSTWLEKDIDSFQFDESINISVQSYVASLYWCIVTMTTIGYGDILPTTFAERIFASFVCVLSSFMFAFSMSSISDIIKSFSQKNEEFKMKMAILNMYMKKRRLNLELQTRVRKYYENQFFEQQDDNEQGAKMIHSLNQEIKEDVLKEIFTNIFKESKFLSTEFSENMISKLHDIAEEKQVPGDEFIFREGERATKLFLVLKGEVQLVLQNSLNMQVINENSLVGLSEFMTNQPYKYSAKCSRFCQFIEINFDSFLETIKSSKLDYERYCELKDRMMLNGEDLDYCIRCDGCGKYGHVFQRCHYLQLSRYEKTNFVESNKRKQITRQPWERKKVSFQTFKGHAEVAQQAQEYADDLTYEEKMNPSQPGTPQAEDTLEKPQQQTANQQFSRERRLSKRRSQGILDKDSTTRKLTLDQNRQTMCDSKERTFGEEIKNTNNNRNSNNNTPMASNKNTLIINGDNDGQDEDTNGVIASERKLKKNTLLPHLELPSTVKQSLEAPATLSLAQNATMSKILFNPQMTPQEVNGIRVSSEFEESGTIKNINNYNNSKNLLGGFMSPDGSISTDINYLGQNDYRSFKQADYGWITYESHFEGDFDKIRKFKNYMKHNNFKKTIKKYNKLIEMNKMYVDLIEKSKVKAEQRRKIHEKRMTEAAQHRTIVKVAAHKRLPSTQKFYSMKSMKIKPDNYIPVAQSPQQEQL